MKKKIFSGALLLAIAATAAFNVNFNMNKSDKLSSLALANIEALAQSESNNAGNGNKFYYTHLKGKSKECTLYSAFDANGNFKWSGEDKSFATSMGWKYSSEKGLKETCPNNGDGCTAYSCQKTN